MAYLICGEEEWSAHKREVDSAWDEVRSAARIFASRGMSWVEDFVAGHGSYKDGYELPVIAAKKAMRKAIFVSDRSR